MDQDISGPEPLTEEEQKAFFAYFEREGLMDEVPFLDDIPDGFVLLVVRTDQQGKKHTEWVHPAEGVSLCHCEAPGNGEKWRSARIVAFSDVRMGIWDRSV